MKGLSKKKKALGIVLLLMLCFATLVILHITGIIGSNNPTNDLKKENLKGKVKSVITKVESSEESVSIITGEYDFGNYVQLYNRSGNLKEVLAYLNDVKDKPEFHLQFKYSFFKQQLKEITYLDSVNSKRKFTYDEMGKLIQVSSEPKGSFVDTTYTYNESGMVIEKLAFIEGGDYPNKIRYEYNDEGKISKITQEIIAKDDYEYTYTSNNAVVISVYGISSFSGERKELTNRVLPEFDSNNNISRVVKLQYDDSEDLENGRLRRKPEQRSVLIYKYEYDKYGNWIRKTISLLGEAIVIKTREIEYYFL